MRGRVAAILLLFLLSIPAFPQCNLSPVYSGQFRASILDVAVDNNDLWAATSYGIALYDRTIDPPRVVASIAVPGVTRLVRVSGGTVYAGSGSSIVFIRKSGNGLQIFNTIDAGGTVNDLVITPVYIFAATSNGLRQIDPLAPANSKTLTTSSPNVTSLALSTLTLYAADGDDTVEKFLISPIVQGTGSLIGGVKSAQVVRLNNNRIYVSDRIQKTAIFTDAGAFLTTVNTAFTDLAPLSGDAVYLSTNDPRVHAVDFTTVGTPIELFEQPATTAGGSINRISALQRAGARLYAAGGDLGLLAWNIGAFAAPFPIHSYNTATSTSVVALNDPSNGNSIYVSRSDAGIYEYRLAANGALTENRHWDTRAHTLWDGTTNRFMLSTTGNSAIVWSVGSPPTAVATIDFGVPADNAALIGTKVYVLSAGGKALFVADYTASPIAVTQVSLGGMKPSWMARAGSSLALAEETAEAQTSIRIYNGTSLGQAVIVDGVPPAGIAANGNLVAIFTYLGITLIDVSTRTTNVIPSSTSAVGLPLLLAFSGSTLLEMTDTSVLAWNTTTRSLIRNFIVPSPPIGINGGNDPALALAAVATSDGMASILVNSPTPPPSLYPTTSGNAYYKKVVIAGKRMLLFDGRTADLYEINNEPHWIGGIRTGGLLDVAASDTQFFTLSAGGIVTAYSYSGDPLAQTTISEGNDSAPLSITTSAGSAWVSISEGCLSTGCVKKTFVLDPKSLAVTATMTGGITDVTTSGTTAYALTDMPGEVRVIDVSNAALPNLLRSRNVEGSRAPTAIAQNGGTIYVLGDQVYSYSATSLAGSGQPAPFQNDPTATLRMAGNCGVMSGHTFGPLLYALPGFTPQSAPPVPAPAQSVAVQNGMAFIVTDDSLEIWSATPLPPPARRRVTH